MEIIDKEQLAKKSFEKSDYLIDDTKYITGYLAGFNEAETYYLKQIKEKDKNIQGWMEKFNDQTGVIAHQSKSLHRRNEKLQEAKELLITAQINLEANSCISIADRIEAFLNKQD